MLFVMFGYYIAANTTATNFMNGSELGHLTIDT